MDLFGEEENIINETRKFAESWNRGDARTISEFFTEDAIRVGSMGETERGRTEIEAAYHMLLERAIPGSKVKMERGTVRFICQDTALWQSPFEIHAPGNAQPAKGYILNVMKKVNGRWLILESHPKIFPA